ncbi:hypothetical protein [Catellatospora sp. NPDC049609]|uniref:hypothetical protein n=1 Tax=Catellatospora sp. NPDC049609 TaxID=3155505 RepID=UPI0034476F33
MRQLSKVDVDRLRRSHRNLWISLVLSIPVILVLSVLIIMAGFNFPLLGPLLGVGVGWLLLIPQRRLLDELGLTRQEAKEILKASR